MFFNTSDLFFYPQRQQNTPRYNKYSSFLDTSDDEDDFFYTPNQSCYENNYYNQLRNQRIKEEQEKQRQRQKQLEQQRAKQLQRAYQQKLEEELLEQELRNSFVKSFLQNKKNQKNNQSNVKTESYQDPFAFSTTDEENENVAKNIQKQQKENPIQQSQKNKKKADKKKKKQEKQQAESQKNNTAQKQQNSSDNKTDKQKKQNVNVSSKEQTKKENKQVIDEKIINLSDSDETVISEEPLNYWEQIGISPQKNNLIDSLIEEYYSPEVESLAKQLSALLKKNYEDCLILANNNKGKSIGQLIDLALNGRQTL